MATEEIDLVDALEAGGHRRDRDRPRRVHRAGRGRATVAHDHAGDPQDARPDRATCSQDAGRRTAARRARGAHRVGARAPPAAVPGRRPRHHRRELRRRRHRDDRARDQRGQRRLCTIVPRVQVAVDAGREGRATLRRPRDAAARAHLQRDRPAHLELRDDDERARAATGEIDGPEQLHVVFLDHDRRGLLGTAVRGHARVHPVRRVPQRLPGLPARSAATRTTRSTAGPMGKVLTPLLERTAPRAATCPSALDALRRVHRGVPGRDPARRPARAPPGRPARARARSSRDRAPPAPRPA